MGASVMNKVYLKRLACAWPMLYSRTRGNLQVGLWWLSKPGRSSKDPRVASRREFAEIETIKTYSMYWVS